MMKFFLFLFSSLLVLNPFHLKADHSNRIYVRFGPKVEKPTMLNFFNRENLKFEPLLRYEQSLSYKLEREKKIELNHLMNLPEIIACELPLLRTFEVTIPNGIDAQKYCQKIMQLNPEIELAEPIYTDFPLGIPNDPYATQQTMLTTIKAFHTWDSFVGDTNVVIGIIDTGVLQEHEDLENSIAPNWNEIPNNGIDDDGNGFVDDFKGYNLAYPKEGNGGFTYHPNEHGTAVAGIAGATTNNGRGIAGVAYKCRIFPIKASDLNSNGINYGYKGILYSALRGFKVVNCSWGRIKPFSPVDQSIIDYAVARGVVIVAAGGNGDNSPYVWYPAGYRGVLAVGEVNQVDYVTQTTTLNHTIRIMAPGIGNWITINRPDGYSAPNYGGTSWSAPVVAGVVAMVCARYPWLSPLQTIEYVRQLSDDISILNSNPFYQKLIPPRINMSKMLSIAPLSIPGISPIKIITKRSDGLLSDRFVVGDTVYLSVDAKNFLGEAHNLRFTLSIADEFETSLDILVDEVNLNLIQTGENFLIGDFVFTISERKQNVIFLRVDIVGENGYRDFFLIPFIPTNPIKDFQNDSIYVSISDKGTLGFFGTGDSRIGRGFGSFTLGNQLFKGGLLVSENQQKVVSALFSINPDGSDFRVVKPFTYPDESLGILDDYLASDLDRIGVQISQKVDFRPGGANFFKIYLEVKNISNRTLNNLSIGYFMDLDVGEVSDSNFTFYEPIYSANLQGKSIGSIQYVSNMDSNIIVATACVGIEPTIQFEPQSAGMNSDFVSTLNKEKMIQMLNSNTSIQFNGVSDVAIFSGISFPQPINPNETRKFLMMFAIGRSRGQLSQLFLNELSYLNVESFYPGDIVKINHNPEEATIGVKVPRDFVNGKIEVFNIVGKKILEKYFDGRNFYEFDLQGFQHGLYILRFTSSEDTYNYKFIKY
ncbi:MAG: S8 family serine peptidase [Candidatus Kapaibacteriales bacterium]